MGAQSSTATINSKVSNRILNNTKTSCEYRINDSINNVTVIVEGGSVENINIKNVANINGASCIMSTYQESEIQNILQDMIKQTDTAVSGLVPSFNFINQHVKINQLIENSISQIQESSCNFVAESNINNVYVVLQNTNGKDVNIGSETTIGNSSCSMDNVSKASTYNQITNDVTQKASIKSLGGAIIVFIIICIIIFIIIMVVMNMGGKGKSMGYTEGMGYRGPEKNAQQNISMDQYLDKIAGIQMGNIDQLSSAQSSVSSKGNGKDNANKLIKQVIENPNRV